MLRLRRIVALACSVALPQTGGCDMPAADGPAPSDTDTDADASSSEGSVPRECPSSDGPTMHVGTISSDEVWRAEDSPHVVASDLILVASVTIEACATVQLGAQVTVSVGDLGSLHADGTADGVVTFERLDPDAAWASIRLVGGTMALTHAVLDGGGDPLNTVPYETGAVQVFPRDTATVADPVLTVDHVEISDSASQGIRLHALGSFDPASTELVISGAAGFPISAEVDSADAIPIGAYTGNADDRILLTTVGPVAHDMTLVERGVPYLVGAPGQPPDLRVFRIAGGPATLTIEPGVELQFGIGGVMRVEPAAGDFPATGALVAVGTEDAPIVFTSATDAPAPGDWLGLTFGGRLAANDRVEHVRVEFAGAVSSSGSGSCPYPGDHPNNEAAIRIEGVPPGQFITHTTVIASARHGIDRGWRDDTVVDFLPTNDLTDVAACRQSVSSLATGACPDPVPCE